MQIYTSIDNRYALFAVTPCISSQMEGKVEQNWKNFKILFNNTLQICQMILTRVTMSALIKSNEKSIVDDFSVTKK